MTVQYQGVWSLQSAAQLQSTQAWTTDPIFDYTTLLLQSDNAANGSQNNTFLDSSSNAFAITRNGNTTQGSFTPFSQSPGWWSNFFGGSGNYVVSNAAVFTNTATTFTIEGWIYPTAAAVSASNIPSVIGDMQPVSTAAYWTFGILASGALSFYWYDGASKSATSNGTVPLNTWTHIAVSVNANAITLYINGVQQSLTGTTTLTNRTGSNSSVAFAQFSTTGSVFTGYVSNFSVLSGTAKYSTSFTPLLAPLPTGTTNQVLLFAYGNTFADSNTATTAKTFTITGTPSVQAFSPFAPQLQWTPSVIGGSGYFDGSGDFLSVPDNVAFTMGAGDFAIEAWVYVTATSGSQAIFGTSNAAGSQGSMSFVLLAQNSSGFPTIGVGYAGVVYTAVSSEALTKNQWNHIAGVRNGAIVTIYVNGVSRGTLNMGTLVITDSTEIVGIGRNGNFNGEYLTGYIASARIVKGSPVYTANFTPPTAPLTAITNTQLLLNFTNAGIFDGTMKNNLETVGNAQVSTAVVKYGSGSMAFDGTGDYLRIPTSQTNSLGSGSWTIEFWVYRVGSGNQIFYDQRSTATQLAVTIFNDGNNILRFFVNGANQISDTGTFPASTWTHVAVAKLNSSTRMFVNGVQVGSTYADTNTYVNNPIFVGAQFDGSGTLNGYIDDLRVTLGIARYTQNFIPPSVALPRQ